MDPNQLYRMQMAQASLAVKENNYGSNLGEMGTPMLAQGIGNSPNEDPTERIECTETVNILDRDQYFHQHELLIEETPQNPTPGSELHLS